ncbi:hypothetical protein [Persicobacter psychrovividus]|uniref:Phospholipase D-like domain-containing protein n=1 Tax=Persicobacter psychrovividus TaxID=387638 RepID=A0ABN6L797_9BACT|nr:hypothetical protein PEPS_11460 [Persicobacter psychrovividus]
MVPLDVIIDPKFLLKLHYSIESGEVKDSVLHDFHYNWVQMNNRKSIRYFTCLDNIDETGRKVIDLIFRRLNKGGEILFTLDQMLWSVEGVYKNSEKLSPFRLHFTCLDKKLSQQLENKYGYKFLTIDDLTKSWGQLMAFQGYKSWSVKNDDAHLRSWEKSTFGIPPKIHSLLIHDFYLFEVVNNRLNEKKLYENLFEILRNFKHRLASQAPVEIMLVTAKNKNFDQKMEAEIHKRVDCELLRLLGKDGFKLTIIFMEKNCQQTDRAHDRFLITNNSYIESGAGFNLFYNKTPKHNTIIRHAYVFQSEKEMRNVNYRLDAIKDQLDMASTTVYGSDWQLFRLLKEVGSFKSSKVEVRVG